jgi:hypothetical protein
MTKIPYTPYNPSEIADQLKKTERKTSDWYTVQIPTMAPDKVLLSIFRLESKQRMREVSKAWYDLFYRMYSDGLNELDAGVVHGVEIKCKFPSDISVSNRQDLLIAWFCSLKNNTEGYIAEFHWIPEKI